MKICTRCHRYAKDTIFLGDDRFCSGCYLKVRNWIGYNGK